MPHSSAIRTHDPILGTVSNSQLDVVELNVDLWLDDRWAGNCSHRGGDANGSYHRCFGVRFVMCDVRGHVGELLWELEVGERCGLKRSNHTLIKLFL